MESTLQDLENRYSRSIERTALLEEELVAKARLEEEVQRLKDELRGARAMATFLDLCGPNCAQTPTRSSACCAYNEPHYRHRR